MDAEKLIIDCVNLSGSKLKLERRFTGCHIFAPPLISSDIDRLYGDKRHMAA